MVAPLYVEADGVRVKTQREPAHRTGYEVKCASAYEGWAPVASPTPGHPRPHSAPGRQAGLLPRRTRRATVPFWEGASLALHRTYDLSRLPLVVVGGDGATWIDGAAEVFARVVRQRDGFHLARDAARGWGSETGAALYTAVRTGDHPSARDLLALPAPAPPRRAGPAGARNRPALPAPRHLAPAGAGDRSHAPPAGAVGAPPPRRAHWSRRQVARARAAVHGQVGTPDAGADWRAQVDPGGGPAGRPRAGHPGGHQRPPPGPADEAPRDELDHPRRPAMAKARELVTNGTLAPWCLAPAGAADAPPPRRPGASPACPGRPCPGRALPVPPPTARPATPVARLQRLLQGVSN